MDDFYFDTEGYLAYGNDYYIRGRRRWQSWEPWADPDIQRILVAIKYFEEAIDPATGLKMAYKIDDRTRLNRTITPEDAYGIVEDVQNGYAPWLSDIRSGST